MNFARINIGIVGNKILSQALGAVFILHLKANQLYEDISNYTIILTTITVISLITTLGRQNTILPLSKNIKTALLKEYVFRLRISSTIYAILFGFVLFGVFFLIKNVEFHFNSILMILAIVLSTNGLINIELFRAKNKLILAEYFRMTHRVLTLILLYFTLINLVDFIDIVLIALIFTGLLSFSVEFYRFDFKGSIKSIERNIDIAKGNNIYLLFWNLLFVFTPILIISLYRIVNMSEISGNFAFYLRISEVFGLVIMALNNSLEPHIDEENNEYLSDKQKFNVRSRRIALISMIVTIPLIMLFPIIEYWEKVMLICALVAKGLQLFYGPIIAILRARMMYKSLLSGYLVIAISQCVIWITVQFVTVYPALAVVSLPLSVIAGFYWMYRNIDIETRIKWSLAKEMF